MVGRAIRNLSLLLGGIALPDDDGGDGDALDPASIAAKDTAALLAITQGLAGVETAKARLDDTVAAARERGISWDRIGAVVGSSKQAARERFGVRPNSGLAS